MLTAGRRTRIAGSQHQIVYGTCCTGTPRPPNTAMDPTPFRPLSRPIRFRAYSADNYFNSISQMLPVVS